MKLFFLRKLFFSAVSMRIDSAVTTMKMGIPIFILVSISVRNTEMYPTSPNQMISVMKLVQLTMMARITSTMPIISMTFFLVLLSLSAVSLSPIVYTLCVFSCRLC